jgi:hypothetical protein
VFTRQPWLHKLQLADVFHNETYTREQRRDEIVKRIKAAPFYDEDDYDLFYIVDELADTDTAEWMDQVWDAFYDWADEHRVWVATF